MLKKAKKKNTAARLLLFLLAIVVVCGFFYAAYRYYYRLAYPIRYERTVLEQSEKNGLPPQLVFAVIRTESGFRPNVQSSVGARGLMQITEDTFAWIQYRVGGGESFEDLYTPSVNITYGTALLRLLLEEFETAENALCAYHAGWGNAKKWLADPEYSPDGINIENIPFGDTSRYVKKVVDTMMTYEKLYDFD